MVADNNELLVLTNEQLTTMMVVMVDNKLVSNPAINSIKNKKLPIKLQYDLRKIFNQLVAEFQLLEEMRQELIKQYTRTDADGNPLVILKDYQQLSQYADLLKHIPEFSDAIRGEFISKQTVDNIIKLTDGKISSETSNKIALTNISEFQIAIKELMSLKVNLDIKKISINFDELSDPKYDSWTGGEMDLLMPLLTNR